MSFKENAYQQMSFTDSFSGLTAREQKALEKSWAKVFADEIFPAIDEKRFSVLYSDKASRPNTPVNVIVGALIIKELFDYSDDEMVENLMLDFRIQYALHTTSFEEQPLSDKTLSRFRKRCYDYETLHSKDLYHDCVKDLSNSIAKMMGISGKVRRMDSMMVESNIRKLSRMELIYTCIAKLAIYMNKINGSALPDDLKHYTDPNDFNKVIYHQRSFIPDLTKVNEFTLKHKKAFALLFLLLLAPSYLIQKDIDLYYSMNKALPGYLTSMQGFEKLKNDFDMACTQFVIVDDSIPAAKLMEMEKKLENMDGVSSLLAYNSIVGPAIPDDILPDEIMQLCKQDGLQLFLVNSKFDPATPELTAQLQQMEQIVKSYDPI